MHYSKSAVTTLLQQLQNANISLSMLKRQIFYIAHVHKLSRLVAWYILVSHLVHWSHISSIVYKVYTPIFMLGMLPQLFKNAKYGPVIVVF